MSRVERKTGKAPHRRFGGVVAAALCLALVGATGGPTFGESAPAPSTTQSATAGQADWSTASPVDGVGLVAYSAPLAATAVRTGWTDTWGAYGRCVLGIGVPVGVAWYFVTALGSRAALAALRSQPVSPAAGAAAKRYATAVWNSCARFLRS